MFQLHPNKKTAQIFEIKIDSSMTRSEVKKVIEKIDDSVEIEEYQNAIKLDILNISRGSDGHQIIYDIVFREEKLQYIAKSDRVIILEGTT